MTLRIFDGRIVWMVNPDIRVVSDDDLDALWRKYLMDGKRADGVFTEIIAHTDPHKDASMAGIMVSAYVVLLRDGEEAGTLHELIYVDGSGRPPAHSHPKTITLRDGTKVRILNKEERKPPQRLRRKRPEIWHPPELD